MFACRLNEPDQIGRRRAIIKELRDAAQEIRELPEGYAIRFHGDKSCVARLADFIAFERECCPFLSFELKYEPYAGPIWLEVHGPEGVKQFIRAEVAKGGGNHGGDGS
ncbi:MAG: hypothetical protein HYZ68_06470 [Chloroflexi bacterium]|nr:hypothetical protein [Chloroflexota bacterium]